LARLREELPWQSVRAFIQPLIDLFRDAIQLGKDREELGHAKFHEGYKRIIDRFDEWREKSRVEVCGVHRGVRSGIGPAGRPDLADLSPRHRHSARVQ
jgi:hypothetical protein